MGSLLFLVLGIILCAYGTSAREFKFALNIFGSNTCNSGLTTRRFVGHTKDVLSVAFSADNRQIVSGSRDHTIKLWNTLGVCKYTIQVCPSTLGLEFM